MSLFSQKKIHASFALIDICSASVAGALTHIQDGKSTIYYTERLPIKHRENEDDNEAMLRTLEDLSNRLLTHGAPILRKETGSGHLTKIFISVSAPWQKTSVRTEHINPPKPFIFTKALVSETIVKTTIVPEGYGKSGESLIATILNGYEIVKPYGKHVARAELIVLSSFLEKKVANDIEEVLRKTYHTHSIAITGFAPVAYAAFREVFPHEKDYIVLHVGAEASELAVIKRGLLVSVVSLNYGTHSLLRSISASVKNPGSATVKHAADWESTSIIDLQHNQLYEEKVEAAKKQWVEVLRKTLQELSTQNALPRTLFLLSDDESREYLRASLDSTLLRSLWLTEEPLRIIPITSNQFTSLVPYRAQAEGDIFLALLALFAQKDRSL
jgi:hypothetical protein